MRERGQKARVMALGTGSSVNRHLLDGLTRAGDGATVYVTAREQPTAAVDTFFRLVDHPVITDITVDWGDLAVTDAEPTRIPDLFASRPLTILGHYRRAGTGSVTLSGTANGRRVELRAQVTLPARADHHALLAPLWARARIESLERDLWHKADTRAVAEITRLGLDFSIVTPWTSFVAVDRATTVSGRARTIVQPIDAPEAVDPVMAAPDQVAGFSVSGASGSANGRGYGGMTVRGYGAGAAGGVSHGSIGHGRVISHSVGVRSMSPPSPAAAAVEVSRDAAPEPPPAAPTEAYAPSEPVRQAFAAEAPALRQAYLDRRAAVATLQGLLRVELLIATDGTVSEATLVEDSVGDAPFAAAILAIVRAMRFPAPVGEVPVRVRVPLRFDPPSTD
jgi:TonB family protein